MILRKLEQNINNVGEHRVTFVVTIEGMGFEFVGFVDKGFKSFEFAKNEMSYFETEIGKAVIKMTHQAVNSNELDMLKARIKELEG